jgi:hypothetical protein
VLQLKIGGSDIHIKVATLVDVEEAVHRLIKSCDQQEGGDCQTCCFHGVADVFN